MSIDTRLEGDGGVIAHDGVARRTTRRGSGGLVVQELVTDPEQILLELVLDRRARPDAGMDEEVDAIVIR